MRDVLLSGFVDHADAWRATLLVPGAWEQPDPEDSATLLAQIARDHTQSDHVPLPLLFRPLAAKRLRVCRGRFEIWQIALNIGFDVGIVDVIVRRADTAPSRTESDDRRRLEERLVGSESFHARVRRPDFSERIGQRLTRPPSTSGAASPNASERASPRQILEFFSEPGFPGNEREAIEACTLALGLSYRDGGRLCVVFPDDLRALVPSARQPGAAGDNGWPILAPVARPDSGAYTVDLTVAYARQFFRVTAAIAQGSFALRSSERIGPAPAMAGETVIGFVRIAIPNSAD